MWIERTEGVAAEYGVAADRAFVDRGYRLG